MTVYGKRELIAVYCALVREGMMLDAKHRHVGFIPPGEDVYSSCAECDSLERIRGALLEVIYPSRLRVWSV